MKTYFLLFVLLLSFKISEAQFYQHFNVPVQYGNHLLQYAWVGGLNNPQFGECDLNHDGINDLMIYDRTGAKVYTFLNNGTPNTVDYTYAPHYEKNFPHIRSWGVLQDFNCDGIADLFVDTTLGIKVYKGYYDGSNELHFNLFSNLLRYQFGSGSLNLLVSTVDIASFVDVNGDGDLDILTFQPNIGVYMYYYENLSEEMGKGCDTLFFKLQDHCWGDFTESLNTDSVFLNQPCPPGNIDGSGHITQTVPDPEDERHSGSTEVSWDYDHDGDMDMLVGDISSARLNFLINGGDSSDAHMISQDTVWPMNSHSLWLDYFPAAFRVDVNNDGMKDMICSPDAQLSSENVACAWYYQNTGNASADDFTFITDSLFTGDMIEVGEYSFPVLFDADNDGLKDLIIANRGYFSTGSNYICEMTYYRNTGTNTAPAFTWVTNDYQNFSSLNQNYLFPSFGDLDGDGDDDMVCGIADGTLIFFRNTAAAGAPANFVLQQANYFGIDVGNNAVPQIIDLTGEGILDLVVGEQNGNLNFYRNTGTALAPDFSQITSNFLGQVLVQTPGALTGYAAPHFTRLSPSQDLTLFVGCERGFIYEFDSIENHLLGAFHLVDSTFNDIYEGANSTITASDLNGDGFEELIVGNYRGGLNYYDTSFVPSVVHQSFHSTPVNSCNIYPNPSDGKINISFIEPLIQKNISIQVYDISGRKVFETADKKLDSHNTLQVDLSFLQQGYYLIKILNGQSSVQRKLIISY